MNEHLESDIGIAALLTVRGFRLLDLVQIGPNRYGFRFADPTSTAADTAHNYFAGAQAEAKALMDALRNLKNRLYAEKGNGHGQYAARPQ